MNYCIEKSFSDCWNNMNQSATRLLREKKLKVTTHRLLILNILLLNTSKAYSSTELLHFLKNEMNKSTVYRLLSKLLERKLILKIIDVDGHTIYKLNMNECANNISHPHLRCRECNTLECLPSLPLSYVDQLKKTGVTGFNIVFGGICSSCSK